MSDIDAKYDEAMADAGFVAALRDPEQLMQLDRMASEAIAHPPRTESFSQAERGGEPILAFLIKRTYRIHNGRCEHAGSGGQEALMQAEVPYRRDVEPPLSSPPFYVNDHIAVKRETDVVIQGLARAYEPGTRKTQVSVRFDKHQREIAVFGPRFGEHDRLGRPRFSEPEPFQAVPLRYDFAFGGVDLRRMLARYARLPDDADVELPAFCELHYPRNPCGMGYLIELTEERFNGLAIPCLEHPSDPLRPERLAVGKPERWLHAPLPACWDWQSEGWFPRMGYLGLAPDVEDPKVVPAEVQRGWAAEDILAIPPVFQRPDDPPRVEFARAASAGMTVSPLPPDAGFELRGIHPKKPLYSFRMPGEVPDVELELGPGVFSRAQPHLDSVVVRPHPGELVVVWSARAPVKRRYEARELEQMRRKVRWRIERKEAGR